MPKARNPQRPVLIEFTSPHSTPGSNGELIHHGKTYLVDLRGQRGWEGMEAFSNTKNPFGATRYFPSQAEELIARGTWTDARMVDAARAKFLPEPEKEIQKTS